MTVRILVDSTADIPADVARELGIAVVPVIVHFGDESFRDGIDIDTPAFYAKLATSSVTPTTSTPGPAEFEDYYRDLIKQGATGILALHIANELSACYNSSRMAAEAVTADTKLPIAVVDSRSVSGGFGLTAVIVAREAREGKSLDELRAHAASLLARTRVVAVLETLEYLRRGGRIGRAKAMAGSLLSVKPLLEIRDGQVVPLEQVRTRAKALDRLAQFVANVGPLEHLAVVASDTATGDSIDQVARGVWQGPIEHFTLGPVVGTHAGPGAGGIVSVVRE